jgi:hypothetical protein
MSEIDDTSSPPTWEVVLGIVWYVASAAGLCWMAARMIR